MADSIDPVMPVVVIGDSTTALSVQRLAARLGLRVFGACAQRSWATRTRYHRRLPRTAAGRWCGELGEAGIAHLRALPFERAVLVPSADDAAMWLAQLPADLVQKFPTRNPPLAALETIQDKSGCAALCEQLDVPAPQTVHVSTEQELDLLRMTGRHELFFKPRNSQAFSSEYSVKGLRI